VSKRRDKKLIKSIVSPNIIGAPKIIDLNSSMNDIDSQIHLLSLQKEINLKKALQSDDINKIYSARKYINSIQKREDGAGKSLLIDPLDLRSGNGYKDKYYTLSYDILRKMSKTHIVNAIIKTRKNQIASFAQPQKDKYSTGFVIQKIQKSRNGTKETKLSAQEEKQIDYITQFILDCGTRQNIWHASTFENFLRLLTDDSLTLDQACFEVVRNKMGQPVEFFAVDGATMRMADYSHLSEKQLDDLTIQGYLPQYAQVIHSKVEAQFYPWELCMGVRNQSTDILTNGYGNSELEDLIKTVTALLNSDQYNSNFFKVGSNPRGLLRYSGNINMNTLEDFRGQWQAQMAGVENMHKTPIVNADKIDWISTHESNRDMEYSKYQEFLIKICSAVYTIDPTEFGFHLDGNTDGGGGGLGNASGEYKLQYSKEKGLTPLLKQIEFWLNKYVVSQLHPGYELKFVGLDSTTEQVELDNDIKAVNSFAKLNEIRAKRDLDPLEFGDMPMNPSYISLFQQNQMMQMGDQQNTDAVEEDVKKGLEANPFVNNFNDYISKL